MYRATYKYVYVRPTLYMCMNVCTYMTGIHACMHVGLYMYVCMYVRTYIPTYLRTYGWMNECLDGWMDG